MNLIEGNGQVYQKNYEENFTYPGNFECLTIQGRCLLKQTKK